VTSLWERKKEGSFENRKAIQQMPVRGESSERQNIGEGKKNSWGNLDWEWKGDLLSERNFCRQKKKNQKAHFVSGQKEARQSGGGEEKRNFFIKT